MRIGTVIMDGTPRPVARREEDYVLLDVLLGRSLDAMEALDTEVMARVREALASPPSEALVTSTVTPTAPYRHPSLILGIGLNYGAHAGDLGENAPRTTPASFLKGDHTITGHGEPIEVPEGIGRVTAEAEVGLVIGRPCHRVSVEDAMSYVAGIVPVLDQTAEEVLLENPRYLTRVKNHPTFFSFGPEVITLDEVEEQVGDLSELQVATVHNGTVHRRDTVSGMTFSPAELLSFHSHIMPFRPGDVLSTGTPGAVPIVAGDTVRCELGPGLTLLENQVVSGPRVPLTPGMSST